VEQTGFEPVCSHVPNTFSTSLSDFSKSAKHLFFIHCFILLPYLSVKITSSIEMGLFGRFLLRLLLPYATIASSALSTNKRPLVREVGMDIISSAFIVLNLFLRSVAQTTTCLHTIQACCQNQTAPKNVKDAYHPLKKYCI